MNSPIWRELVARYDGQARHIVIVDDQLTVRGASDLLGVGLDPETLMGTSALDLIHPGDLERAAEVIAQVMEHSGPRSPGLYRLRTGSGFRSFDVAAVHIECETPAGWAIVYLINELDDRRRAETLAKEQIDIMALFAARAPIGVCLAALTQLAERHVDGLEMRITCLVNDLSAGLGADSRPDPLGNEPLGQGDVPDHAERAIRRGVAAVSTLEDGSSVVVTPIKSLSGEILGYTEGRRARESVPSNSEWSVHELVAGLAGLFIERIRDDERIAHTASHDPLTDLANRRLLNEELDRQCAGDEPFGLVVVDLDQFAWINNTHGHPVGDLVLIETGRRLQGAVGERALVARPGGDEFVIVVPGIRTDQQMASLGQRLHDALQQPTELHGIRYIQASIGLARRGRGDSPESLLAAADSAMYVAKRAGGDACHLPTPLDRRGERKRFDRVRLLSNAIENDELHLVYQPMIELATRRWVDVEALVRWERDGSVVAGPEEFVALAEQSDLILALDEWVLRTAGSQLERWSETSLEPGGVVWINLSPRTIARTDLVDVIWSASNVVRSTGSGAVGLGIEVTERAVDTEPHRVAEVLAEVRRAGIPVALDDFGTGMASLQQLAELPVTDLKIDGSFVSRMIESPKHRTMVEIIVLLAQRLGLKVTAESIESLDQLSLLTTLGCTIGQGYFISPPRRLADLLRWSPAPVHPLL